ncbi:M23 family metallopeptidase [Actinobaculum sp. 352]|uniref:M23 family metallopeptidase n=2 Tax=unclassified Actinobaculum TaxID=2609299 RepID=UPI001F49FAA6|nr:M23 family metallopeptidase [Actinobaculum sp. 352]
MKNLVMKRMRTRRRRRLSGLLAVGALCLSGLATAGPAFATDRDDLVEQQEQQAAEIESLQSSLEGVDSDLQAIYLKTEETRGQVATAEAELAIAQNELAAAERDQQAVAAQLEAAQAELESIEADIEQGEYDIEKARNNLAELGRAQYRGESTPSTVDMIVNANSTEDFLDSYASSEALNRAESSALTQAQQAVSRNETRAARQSDVEEQISGLKDQADALVEEKTEKEANAQNKKDELEELQASYEGQAAELESRKEDFQASLDKTQSAYDDTAAAIAAIDAENARRAAAASSGGGGGGTVSTGSSWLIPVVPTPLYVTSPFGMRWYPITGGYWMHNGVDLRSTCGSPQYAPANGTIARVIPAAGNSTHGNQIYVNLGTVNGHSWVVVTNHLSAFNVSVGQTVRQGDIIGYTGQTGDVTGCHVHMEVWRDGSVIDPMSLPGFTTY